MRLMNLLAGELDFKIAELNDETINGAELLNEIEQELNGLLNKKIKQMTKITPKITKELKYEIKNLTDEILFEYSPNSINIKDDLCVYVFEISGTIDFNIIVDTINNDDKIPKLSTHQHKIRLVIDKDDNSINNISKLVAEMFLCPFITRENDNYFEMNLSVEKLKFLAQFNKLPYLDLIGDKIVAEFVNEILGLNDLGKALKWRNLSDTQIFERIELKLVDIINKLLGTKQYMVITKIQRSNFIEVTEI